MSTVLYTRVAIIGLGLIGSSLARAIKAASASNHISGYDLNAQHMQYCVQGNIIDSAAPSAAECVLHADLIILCTPASTFNSIISGALVSLKSGTVITDAASVKELPLQSIMPILPNGVVYIPAHPISGNEHSGPEAGSAELLNGRRVILTPDDSLLEHPALSALQQFWQRIGMIPEFMPAFLHDQIYATVSHLPQLISYAAMGSLHEQPYLTAPKNTEIFTRFTRLSSSPALLWTDIFLTNQRYLVAALDDYIAFIQQILGELREGDKQGESSSPAADANTNLFPRITASCLVSVTLKLEKQVNIRVARFAGKGFADVAAAALEVPEKDIERISNHYQAVTPILQSFIEILIKLRSQIALGLASDLLLELERIRSLKLKFIAPQ